MVKMTGSKLLWIWYSLATTGILLQATHAEDPLECPALAEPPTIMAPPKFPDFEAIFARTLESSNYQNKLNTYMDEVQGEAESEGKTYNCICMWGYLYGQEGLDGFNRQLEEDCSKMVPLDVMCPTTTTTSTTTTTTTTTPIPTTTTTTTTAIPTTTTTTAGPTSSTTSLTTSSSTTSSQKAPVTTVVVTTAPLSNQSSTTTSAIVIIPNTRSSTNDPSVQTTFSSTTEVLNVTETPTVLPLVSGKSVNWTYVIAFTTVAVVVLGLLLLGIICIVRCRESKTILFKRQKSDLVPIKDADDAFTSGSRTPSLYSTNGSIPYSRKFSTEYWEEESGVRDVESDGISRKVLVLEPVERGNGEYDFRTLKAIEHSHALVFGDFGESSTDKTLPKTKRSTKKRKGKKKVEETALSNNNEPTVIFVRDPRTSKGSIKSMDSVKRKSIALNADTVVRGTIDRHTVSSKAGVAYIVYENEDIKIACNSHRSSPDGSLSPSETLDSANTTATTVLDHMDSKSIGSTDFDGRSCDSRDERAIEEWKDMIQQEFDKPPPDELVNANNEHLFAYDNNAMTSLSTQSINTIQLQTMIEPPSEFKDASFQRSVPNLTVSSNHDLTTPPAEDNNKVQQDIPPVLPEPSDTDSETGPLVKQDIQEDKNTIITSPQQQMQQKPLTTTVSNGHVKPLPDGPITVVGFVNQAFELGEKTDSQWSVNDNTMSSTTSSAANVAVVQPQRLSVKNLMSKFEDNPPDNDIGNKSYNSLPNPKRKGQNSWKRESVLENVNELPSETHYGTMKPVSKVNSSDEPPKIKQLNGHIANQGGSLKYADKTREPAPSQQNSGLNSQNPETVVIMRDKNNFLWNKHNQSDKPSAHVQPQVQETHADVRL